MNQLNLIDFRKLGIIFYALFPSLKAIGSTVEFRISGQVAHMCCLLPTATVTDIVLAHYARSFIHSCFQSIQDWRNDRTISHLSLSARTLFYWQCRGYSLAAPVIYWDCDNVKCVILALTFDGDTTRPC